MARLDSSSLAEACNELSAADLRLGRLISENGRPPMWERSEGFPTMVKIVLEQQVSLDSAAAAYSKLEAALGVVDPERFVTLDDDELKVVGFSRQKSGYCRGIAQQLLEQTFSFDEIRSLSDIDAKQELIRLRGSAHGRQMWICCLRCNDVISGQTEIEPSSCQWRRASHWTRSRPTRLRRRWPNAGGRGDQ